jgi:hypothetical protein
VIEPGQLPSFGLALEGYQVRGVIVGPTYAVALHDGRGTSVSGN